MTEVLRARPTRAATGGGRLRGFSLVLALGTIALLGVIWEVVPRLGLLDRLLFPTLSDTAASFVQLVGSGYWWEDLAVTLIAVVAAWLLGCSLGFIVGVLLGTSPFIRTAVTPYVIAVQALPKIVVAPLFIGWLGFGPPSKIALAVAICFFPVWIDTMVGLALPSANEFKLMQSLNATRRQTFVKLQLPAALPMIMVGVKHATLLAFTGVLVAEILSASAGGLGTLAETFSQQLSMGPTFAVVLVVVVIAITLVSLMDLLERRVVFWSDGARSRTRRRRQP